ncbi:MAG: hypothetical protein H0U94_06940, partial [Acidobacteria bacterium]|nr:hypothetical protein [Acidobacteriota bacterium]
MPRCGGFVLRRRIPQTAADDAMGCYPLFACQHWRCLGEDVTALGEETVALSLVTDPLGDYGPEELRTIFPDLCRPYKDHFVVDLDRGYAVPSTHHRRNVRRAQGSIEVERSPDPAGHAAEWVSLYQQLIARYEVRGIPAFSPVSLVCQLQVPGLTMFRGVYRGVTAGITLWYTQGDSAYYHLGAYSGVGYAMHASFAIFHQAIEHFRGRVRILSLGAGAGAWGDGTDGLTRFKRGWATGTRPAWLCGRIFDHRRYAAL